MTNFDHDDLPPDLSEMGRRLRDERPVAEDDALDRMMQRAHTPSPTPRRKAKRGFAASLATMIAMLSVTGVAAAAIFGFSFPLLGNALTGGTSKVGSASSQALTAPAAPSSKLSSSSKLPITIGSAVGSLSGLSGFSPFTPASRGTTPSAAAPPSTAALPGVGTNALPGLGSIFNGGFFQYGPGRFICRILRFFGLDFIANLLGCP